MSDDFDWSATNEDVLMPEQRATAIYTNNFGQAVIRQERAWDEDEDTYVVIDHANIPAVIMKLREIGDQPVDRVSPDETPPPPKDVVVLAERRGEHSRATE